MSDRMKSTRCKYFNTGFCKCADRCRFKHPASKLSVKTKHVLLGIKKNADTEQMNVEEG